MNRQTHKDTLTPVGMLAVVTIVGILIAILLPVVKAADGSNPPESPCFVEAIWIAPPLAPEGANDNGIDGMPLFRKEFSTTEKPRSATLRIVGLGDYDLHVNGHRVTDTGVNQPWSQYEKTLYYRDFDITALLTPGMNCVGVMLGNSFWHNPDPPSGRYNKVGPPQRVGEPPLPTEPLLLCAELTMRDASGAVRRIFSDASWRVGNGPVIFSHIYGGEDFDARRQCPGWDRAGYDDCEWKPARVAMAPPGRLRAQHWPPFKAFEVFEPSLVMETEPGVFLYVFPQNCSAQLRYELTGGKKGDRIAFRCGEHKNAQNRLFGDYVVGCETITDGKPLRCQWLFYYSGMQFVEVSGAVPAGHANPRDLPVLQRLELVHVRTALPEVGAFRCSSDLLNRTHQLIDWAMRSNTSHVMTDCPHREKLGWLECAYLLAPTFLYRYDGRDWFAKIAQDIYDAQEPSGRVLTVAPRCRPCQFPGPYTWTVEWGAAAVFVPWHHYEWFGDSQILRDNYDMMRRFTDYIATEAKDGLAPGGLGDWYDYGHGAPPGPSQFTPPELSATATWALCAKAVSLAAEVLGRLEDAKQYRRLHQQIAADFQRHFQDPTTRKLRNGGSPQTANAMALCADLVPAADRSILLDDIVSDLEKRDWQQTPGDVGHVYLIRALAEGGRSDVLHKIYARQSDGSYGGILRKGLTALPETWDAIMDGVQSLNHCMLGHVVEWLYGYVAGIRQPPNSVGWKNVIIGPNPGPLKSAEASLHTPAGVIAARWRVTDGMFRLETSVPSGVKTIAVLPSGKKVDIPHGDHAIQETWNENGL